MTKNKAWVSRIDFRPDPTDPKKNAISLGLMLEFTTADYWAIGIVMLAAIDDVALASLDELSRKLIENRQAVINHEVRRTLPQARKPGQALPLLAAANPRSIHISNPAELDISKVRSASGASVEKIAEQYALSLFVRDHESVKGKAPPATSSRHMIQNPALVLIPEDCPPPWILPASCVIRPLHW
jgi:hypothetical protein